ncbi:hypothetical protein ACHAP5_003253 [Fusarium lateritium]
MSPAITAFRRGSNPAPTGFPPAIRHHIGLAGQTEYAQPEGLRHVPARPIPVLQQYKGLDGRLGFAQLGSSTPTQSLPTAAVKTHGDNVETKTDKDVKTEDEYSMIEHGEEDDDFVIKSVSD